MPAGRRGPGDAKDEVGGYGRGSTDGVHSERRSASVRSRKRKREAADWREVKRWTGVRPLRRGSASKEATV